MIDAYWKGQSVLVTGATGLVGSWLSLSLIEAGAQVVGLVRDIDPRSQLHQSGAHERIVSVTGDLTDLQTLERAIVQYQAGTVFHLGAQAIVSVAEEAPLETFESNIRGTYNLLEACRRHPAVVRRVVVASSDKAYGAHDTLPYTEDMPLQGRRPYEVSKSASDLLARCYFESYGLPVAIARCGNIYGGGDLNWSRLIPDVIRATVRGERPVLRSDGQYVRDYIYVKDVVTAYERLARAVDEPGISGEAFNFSPERPFTVLEVVRAIQQAMGASTEPEIRDVAGHEIHSQYLDAGKAHSKLGWAPKYSLEAGLAETIDWYRAFLAKGVA
jgi:CDP-glucose 4,6-dehydratase